MRKKWTVGGLLVALAVALSMPAPIEAGRKDKKKGKDEENPYAAYVWPPPPDEAKIGLDDVVLGRADIETKGKLTKKLFGATPQEKYDWLRRPFGVALDAEGRVLVTDTQLAALFRFDFDNGRVDIMGTTGPLHLVQPLGLGLGSDGTIYVADIGVRKVLAYDQDSRLVSSYGRTGELTNPTDAAVAPNGKRLFVTDSKAHQIVVFDVASAQVVQTFGRNGSDEGEFAFPSALSFGPEGQLYVVDQLNARIQVFDGDGSFVDSFGGRGVGFGDFVRPKDVAVDDVGYIYVSDAAFNNIQIFDLDFSLLTFVGQGGSGPGQFLGPSGIAVAKDRFVVVDQLGHRLQMFSYLSPRSGE